MLPSPCLATALSAARRLDTIDLEMELESCVSSFYEKNRGANVNANEGLITKFYTAFQQQDAATMASCYHQDITFSDPVFPSLHGQAASGMWRMLCARAQNFSLVFNEVQADATTGSAHWIATYTFSQTGRTVVNDIRAKFVFAEGKIIQHQDHFDLWKWARQALGLKGLLLGWSAMVRSAVQKQAAKSLQHYLSKQN